MNFATVLMNLVTCGQCLKLKKKSLMELERKKIEGGCCVGGGAPCNDKSTSGINIRCIPHLHNCALIEIITQRVKIVSRRFKNTYVIT